MADRIKLLVTPYKNPDLDGTACAFAYAEFFQKNDKAVVAAIFGTPHREAQFVLNKFNIPALADAEAVINEVDEIIIVDASDLRGLSDKIKPEKVIEIIDHRKINEAYTFPNAKAQIELVGSAATLIAEKFFNSKTAISQESAALLFSAIISNTINFQANVTTERDHKMADWLKTNFSVPPNYIHEMFLDKSQFKKSLKETFLDDFATFHFNNHNLGIAQLEIINVNKFIRKDLTEIKKILKELKKERSLDFIFLTVIDLEKAFNEIVVIDEKTQKLVEQALKIEFKDGVAKKNGIIMRKEIIPLIKDVLGVGKLF
ncbi:MAG: DHHA2 domain-containing protein [Candidatus Buchananbacteria bacterium]|jgi:manganese-dependent inorganic pyrophosphatase